MSALLSIFLFGIEVSSSPHGAFDVSVDDAEYE